MATPQMEDAMKTCFKCQCKKDRAEFYKHPKTADGLLGKCKECTKKDVRLDRQKTGKAREYDKRRFKNNPDRRARVIADAHRRRKENPEKYKAHTLLGSAVKCGRIKKPFACSICGNMERRIEAHHPDYTKPLEVVWCCTPCHRVLDGRTKLPSIH